MREFAVKEKTRITNNLKMVFFTRGQEIPFNDLTTQKALLFLISNKDLIIKQQGKMLKQVMENIKEYENEIKNNIPIKAEKLLILKGISELRARRYFS